MAEHLNQKRAPEMEAFNMMGKPILMDARTAGYKECLLMGLSKPRALECTNAVAEQLQRDQPYEAQKMAMQHLDLCGYYRLMATILVAAAEEAQAA